MLHSRQYELYWNQINITGAVERITLAESLDEVACRAELTIVKAKGVQITAGDELILMGIPADEPNAPIKRELYRGVAWSVEELNGRTYTVTAYDYGIYLARCEDEYLFAAGRTATARVQTIAKEWGIPTGTLTNTGVALSRALFRAQTLYEMIFAGLRETVQKGGGLHRIRMSGRLLELVKLGSNPKLWVMAADSNLTGLTRRLSLEGTVTRVKVLGHAAEGRHAAVLAHAQDKAGVKQYGAIQKIVISESHITLAQAKKLGEKSLVGPEEGLSCEGIDLNNLRAGDKLLLDGKEWLAVSVSHELGSPGRMQLELGAEADIRRRFYHE